MPLLRDLGQILIRAQPETLWSSLGRYLSRLLSAVDDDIELLLTLLHSLQEAFFWPRKQNSLGSDFIDQILNSGAIREIFAASDLQLATRILHSLREIAEEDPVIRIVATFLFNKGIYLGGTEYQNIELRLEL